MKPIPVALLEDCGRGDRRAVQELYSLVFGFMMGISARYYVNREDRTALVNEAFFKILQSLQKNLPSGNFEAWCRRVTMNSIIDDFRKNKMRKENTNGEVQVEDYALSERSFNLAESSFQEEDLEKLLHQLPAATRYVFNMFAIEGYTHAEIAGSLDISEGTSKWHVSEARRLLRIALEKKVNEG